MVSSRFIFFLYAIFIFTAQAVVAQTCSLNNGEYIANSSYEANLNHLLHSLYSNTEIHYGFYNSSYGQSPDKVYAIALCRGGVKLGTCRACINEARSLFKQLCPNQREAIILLEECMFHYSNRFIFGVVDTAHVLLMPNAINVSADYVDQFNDDVRSLLERLRRQAAAGGPLRKFAVGNATAPNSQTLYGLVQCTPELSELDCNNCLAWTIEDIPRYCGGKEGARITTPSCNIRFEIYLFYDSTVAASTSPSVSVSPPPPLTNGTTYPYPCIYAIILLTFNILFLGSYMRCSCLNR
jgi:hypothetical protein